MEAITEQVARLIKESRKAKGITQQEMADKLGVSKSAYSRYEGGKQNLTIETLQKVGDVIGGKLVILYQ